MAPRKTAASDKTPKTKRTPPVKKSEDKDIKRPARGYHEFLKGLLNVAPKGREMELAKQNQTSRLLVLPPEIRNDIWKLVLGGKIYHARNNDRFQTSQAESKNATALLRTCRQMYAEAALMPLTLTKFSGSCFGCWEVFKKLKAYQRKHITSFQIDCACFYAEDMLHKTHLQWFPPVFAQLLPSLEQLRVQVFSAPDMSARRITEERVLEYYKPSIQGMSVTVEVEQTDEKWPGYNDARDMLQICNIVFGYAESVADARWSRRLNAD